MSFIKTPSFWYRKPFEEEPSLGEKALTPVSHLYEWLYRLHQNSKTPYKAAIPVLCIGNIVAGGTGKTPTALALLELIQTQGLAKKPHFLIRGYGGSEYGPVLVDPLMHSAWEVGDEALILVKKAPTIVSADRAAGVKFAERRGADLIIMDDGLQNPGLEKDLRLMTINGEMGFGNEKLLPAGPLRQPLVEGIKKADAFILIGEDRRNVLSVLPPDKSVLRARLVPDPSHSLDRNRKYFAFAGLGYPEKFFSFLKDICGLNIAGSVAFADHYPYTENDIRELNAKADAVGAQLVTTEKDHLRLPAMEDIEVAVMHVHIIFENEPLFLQIIRKSLNVSE